MVFDCSPVLAAADITRQWITGFSWEQQSFVQQLLSTRHYGSGVLLVVQ